MLGRARHRERGSTSIQVVVILVPVFLGFIGFAVDLGRLYLIRGELKTAANAMALAAASQLIGTEASVTLATASSRLPVENTGGYANKYDFGNIVIGEGNGRLSSSLPEPTFYQDAASARGDGEGSGDESGSSTARYVRIDLTADAPLIFWGLLPLGQERRTPISVRAVAGISAPLCAACGIEPIAIAPITAEDTTDFGFVVNQRYTLGYMCTGGQQPSGIAGATQRIPYLLLNRYNEAAEVFPDETSQAYRIGAGGLPGNTNPALGCVRVNAAESIWATAAPGACQQNVAQTVTGFTCGLVTRFNTSLPTGCENIAEASNIVTAYSADTDITDLEDFTAYTGNTRRVITIPVVEALSAAETMNVLGFRQFLLQPTLGEDGISGTDINGRFVVSYLGNPVPLRSGSFSGCSVTSGPGKVVLHR